MARTHPGRLHSLTLVGPAYANTCEQEYVCGSPSSLSPVHSCFHIRTLKRPEGPSPRSDMTSRVRSLVRSRAGCNLCILMLTIQTVAIGGVADPRLIC